MADPTGAGGNGPELETIASYFEILYQVYCGNYSTVVRHVVTPMSLGDCFVLRSILRSLVRGK